MSILALSLSACSKPTHNASEDIKATAQTQAAASHEAASPNSATASPVHAETSTGAC